MTRAGARKATAEDPRRDPREQAPKSDSGLPPTPAAMHIMLALAEAELHGYAIMGEVKELSEGRYVIGPGTLYRSLQRMERDGLIVETDGPVDPEWSDERRRYYRLTDRGRAVAEAEARRFEDLVAIARRRGILRSVTTSR